MATGIGETGQAVEDILGRQAQELAGAVVEALRKATAMSGEFAHAVEGSENKSAELLRGHLSEIVRGLGSVVDTLGETERVKADLFHQWGIDPAGSSVTVTESAPISPRLPILSFDPNADTDTGADPLESHPSPLAPETPRKIPWLNGAYQSCLTENLGDVLISEADRGDKEEGNAHQIAGAMQRWGIDNVRGVLLTGASNLAAAPGMDSKKIAWLKEALSRYLPDMPLPDSADPAVAAKLCPSLDAVPLSVLDPSYCGLRDLDADHRVSVKEILSRNPEELFLHKYDPSEGNYDRTLTTRDREDYGILRARAIVYAEKFEQARST
ncbi:MAG TPA: hypothetical protein VMR45_05250 [Patescibacteria group bacterium]|nr:hypothetical protein [Patescibacteria group bacterium]